MLSQRCHETWLESAKRAVKRIATRVQSSKQSRVEIKKAAGALLHRGFLPFSDLIFLSLPITEVRR